MERAHSLRVGCKDNHTKSASACVLRGQSAGFATGRSARGPRGMGFGSYSHEDSKLQPPTWRGSVEVEPRPTAWDGAPHRSPSIARSAWALTNSAAPLWSRAHECQAVTTREAKLAPHMAAVAVARVLLVVQKMSRSYICASGRTKLASSPTGAMSRCSSSSCRFCGPALVEHTQTKLALVSSLVTQKVDKRSQLIFFFFFFCDFLLLCIDNRYFGRLAGGPRATIVLPRTRAGSHWKASCRSSENVSSVALAAIEWACSSFGSIPASVSPHAPRHAKTGTDADSATRLSRNAVTSRAANFATKAALAMPTWATSVAPTRPISVMLGWSSYLLLFPN